MEGDKRNKVFKKVVCVALVIIMLVMRGCNRSYMDIPGLAAYDGNEFIACLIPMEREKDVAKQVYYELDKFDKLFSCSKFKLKNGLEIYANYILMSGEISYTTKGTKDWLLFSETELSTSELEQFKKKNFWNEVGGEWLTYDLLPICRPDAIFNTRAFYSRSFVRY